MSNKWHLFSLFGIAILGIVFGSFFDLQINQAIYSVNNGFGIAMSAFGCLPVYIGLSCYGAGYFIIGLKQKNMWARIGLIILGIIAIVASIYFQADMIVSVNAFNIQDMFWYVGIPIGIVIAGLGCWLGYHLFIRFENIRQLLIILLIAPLVLLMATLIVNITKGIMCRPRFRFLYTYASTMSDYRNWWETGTSVKDAYINTMGVTSEEFKSFPSGHTATIFSLIPFLVYLPKINEKYCKYETILFYIGLIWILLVAFSRILVGAHFLTDVSFGLLIGVAIFTCFDLVLFNKKTLKEKEQL